MKRKTLQIDIEVNDLYDTIDCVRPTQSRFIWIIHRNVGLKCFFHLPNFCCYYR